MIKKTIRSFSKLRLVHGGKNLDPPTLQRLEQFHQRVGEYEVQIDARFKGMSLCFASFSGQTSSRKINAVGKKKKKNIIQKILLKISYFNW